MRTGIFEEHYQTGHDGAPDGGTTWGQGFCISWQKGPLGPVGFRRQPNGAFVEDIIQAAIGRIEFYQLSPFSCEENAQALKHLREAAKVLDSRTKRRMGEGTEGTHEGK